MGNSRNPNAPLFCVRTVNAGEAIPVATLALIGLNVVLWLCHMAAQKSGYEIAFDYGLVSQSFIRAFSHPLRYPDVLDNALFPLVSSMFTHGAWQHLLTNVIVLWIFGGTVEKLLGRAVFLGLFMACGVGASLVHVAVQPNLHDPLVGASGAISGVLGAYVVAYPRGRIQACLFRRCIECPAIPVIALYLFGGLILEAALLVLPGTYRLTRVGYVLHGAGFVAGAALMAVFRKRASPESRE